MNLDSYSFEFTAGTVLYIVNHLSYKFCNENELESTLIEIVNPKKLIIIVGIHSSKPLLKWGMNFLKIGQKGGIQFFFNKVRGRKKGWGSVIRGGRGDKENLQNFFNFFKGNQNFQGILN